MKKVLLFLALTIMSLDAKNLTLQDKRVIAKVEKNVIEKFKNELNTILGTKLAIEIHWDSIAKEQMSHMYEESLSKVYTEPVVMTMKNIMSDDLGKKALSELITKKKLTKIVFSNKLNTTKSDGITLKDSILIIDQESFSNFNPTDVKTRSENIYKALNL